MALSSFLTNPGWIPNVDQQTGVPQYGIGGNQWNTATGIPIFSPNPAQNAMQTTKYRGVMAGDPYNTGMQNIQRRFGLSGSNFPDAATLGYALVNQGKVQADPGQSQWQALGSLDPTLFTPQIQSQASNISDVYNRSRGGNDFWQNLGLGLGAAGMTALAAFGLPEGFIEFPGLLGSTSAEAGAGAGAAGAETSLLTSPSTQAALSSQPVWGGTGATFDSWEVLPASMSGFTPTMTSATPGIFGTVGSAISDALPVVQTVGLGAGLASQGYNLSAGGGRAPAYSFPNYQSQTNPFTTSQSSLGGNAPANVTQITAPFDPLTMTSPQKAVSGGGMSDEAMTTAMSQFASSGWTNWRMVRDQLIAMGADPQKATTMAQRSFGVNA